RQPAALADVPDQRRTARAVDHGPRHLHVVDHREQGQPVDGHLFRDRCRQRLWMGVLTADVSEGPPRGSGAGTSLLRLSGLEQLQTFVDGRSPRPPVARLTGRRIVEAELGRVVYALPVSDWLVGPKGTLHPGVISFLADAPLLAAVQSML